METLKLLVITFFAVTTASGQLPVVDSLEKLLKQSRNDTMRLVLSQRLSWEWLNINSDTSLHYSKQYRDLSDKLAFEINKADALRLSGTNYFYIGNFSRALELFFKALKSVDNNSAQSLPVSYFRAMAVPDHLTLSKYKLYVSGLIHNNMGVLYWVKGHQKQEFHYTKLFDLADATQAEDLKAWAYLRKGITGKNHDSALWYLHRALNIASKLPNFKFQGSIAEFIGHTYSKRKEYAAALKYLRLSVKLNLENQNIRNSGWSYLTLAGFFTQQNLSDSAIKHAQNAMWVAVRGNYPDVEAEAIQLLAKEYDKLNNLDSASKYFRLLPDVLGSRAGKEDARQFDNVELNQQLQEKEIARAKEKYSAQVKLYALLSGLLVALIIAIILVRNLKQKKKANTLLQLEKNTVEKTLIQLKATQSQLIQSEKMASLGELTAGIAHEIQNPLNFINNFSDVNTELIEEMRQELNAGNNQEGITIANEVAENETKINHHGKRADAIVKSMLQHSRASTNKKEPTDINKLADEYLRLSYHGFRAKDQSFNVTVKTSFDEHIRNINIIPQDIGRVLLNLYNNAFYAVAEKKKKNPEGYEPKISVSTKKIADRTEITVKDNGNGIPQELLDKIFQPFFTTKPTGQGTGLGLSLSYDIVKVYGGEIKVETKEGEGSEFMIQLPLS